MVFYNLLVLTKPYVPAGALTEMFRMLSREVLKAGGVIRGLENHGIWDLPNRMRAKHVDRVTGTRSFWRARYVVMNMDSSPTARDDLERRLRVQETVLRYRFYRPKTKMDAVDSATRNNPWREGAHTYVPGKRSEV